MVSCDSSCRIRYVSFLLFIYKKEYQLLEIIYSGDNVVLDLQRWMYAIYKMDGEYKCKQQIN